MTDFRRWLVLLGMVIWTSGCAAPARAPSPRVALKSAALPAAVERHLSQKGPRVPAIEAGSAKPAAEVGSSPLAERRCTLTRGGDAAGFYPSDAWPAGNVVLTFDDGPHPGKTPKVLDLLAKHEMPATFFLVGRAISKKTFHLVQRMVAEGHTLGSHSYNHDVDMAERQLGERTIEYIRGQHETTQILIELALVAGSADDFERIYQRVFERKSDTYLPSGGLRKDWPAWAKRHAELLGERGYANGERPYPIVLSRPPGGGPYLSPTPNRPQRRVYDSAMERLGWLNVMWHGESGDTNPEKKHDFGFLTTNLRHFSKKGGVLLVHDYIRTDALGVALAAMSKDPAIQVVPMEDAIELKFGCGSREIGSALLAPRAD
jgi:peptidoglycan/xylan/chitin deacetylase (PgdA/CDA1 family)